MVPKERGLDLHGRSCHNEPLTDEERAELERFYAEQDAEEMAEYEAANPRAVEELRCVSTRILLRTVPPAVAGAARSRRWWTWQRLPPGWTPATLGSTWYRSYCSMAVGSISSTPRIPSWSGFCGEVLGQVACGILTG